MGRQHSKNPTALGTSVDAAEWFTMAQSGGLTRPERKQLLAWLKRSPENVAELLRVADLEGQVSKTKLVQRMGSLKESGVISITREDAIVEHEDRAHVDHVTTRRTAAAAEMLGLAISSTYLTHFQRHTLQAIALLLHVSVFLVATTFLNIAASLPAAFVAIGLLLIVALKHVIVDYRVSRGLFGSTASEARALIRFVVKHSDIIDFDDTNGKARPVFERAAQSAEPSSIPRGAATE
jgi:hypothetical protein